MSSYAPSSSLRSQSRATSARSRSSKQRSEHGTSSLSTYTYDDAPAPKIRRNARDAVDAPHATVAVDADVREESVWETFRQVVAHFTSASQPTSTSRRRKFCILVRDMAASDRGLYGLKRFPGAVSALKRLVVDADLETRLHANDAVAALAASREGVSMLCSNDDALFDTAMLIRAWEWRLALERIKATFGSRVYWRCRLRVVLFKSKATSAFVSQFLSPRAFDPLQTHVAKRMPHNIDIGASLSSVIGRINDDIAVLNAATKAMEVLLATATVNWLAEEPIPYADDVPRTSDFHLRRASPSELGGITPVEAFMGDGFIGGSRTPGCVSNVWRILSSRFRKRAADEDEAEDDVKSDGGEAFGFEKANSGEVSFSITQNRLARKLMMLTRHENDSLRERACRVLYEYSARASNDTFGERVYDMLIGTDSKLRAGTLSWLAYLFLQHIRNVRAFSPQNADDKPPLSNTVRFLLSDAVVRSASQGLTEEDAAIRESAARALRVAWDAVAVVPNERSSVSRDDDEDDVRVAMDDRLTFALDDRWLTFVNAGAARALCDMQLSDAVGAPQLANTVLEHMAKTDRDAALYILSREHALDAAAERALTRRRVEEHKSTFKSHKHVPALPAAADVDDDEDKSHALALSNAGDNGGEYSQHHIARWREYRTQYTPITAKFVEGELPERAADDWRARAEEYILAGGAASNKNGRTRRGPYERAILHEGGIGLAAKYDKLPVIFPDAPAVGPYAHDKNFVSLHTSAKKYTRPSDRHRTRATKKMIVEKFNAREGA